MENINLKPIITFKLDEEFKRCIHCNCPLTSKNCYPSSLKINKCVCKSCTNIIANKRTYANMVLMTNYLGGCCSVCGYKRSLAALQFHHLDPSKKEFRVSDLRKLSFNDKVKRELDKCILVCATCHAEIHWAPDGKEIEQKGILRTNAFRANT